jgi:hypothetical protein
VLNDVVTLTATNAWAVGHSGSLSNPQTLIEHWNGTAWRRISVSPSAGWLNGVAATSPHDIWAVGFSGARALFLHFNGTRWRRVASPAVGSARGVLADVTVISPRNAWAAGGIGTKTLIEHWNGTEWRRVPSPSPQQLPLLTGISAASAGDVWAVGGLSKTLILHWNGSAWRRLRAPAVGSGAGLLRMSGTSPRNVWAVGATRGFPPVGAPRAGFALPATGTEQPVSVAGAAPAAEPLILHWNGTAWRRMSTPVPANGGMLIGVGAASGHNAWAVGCTRTFASSKARPFVLHWHGTAWR